MTGASRPEKLLADDARARARALDPERSFLVQAPAGSGKTTLLAARYLALLAAVEHPEEIVALTFTRKAAGEMSQRVLDALAMPAREGAGELGVLAARAHEHARRRHWDEAELPLRLRIHTIDQLALGIVRRLPQRAGPLALCKPSDEAGPMYRAAARLLLEEAAGEGDVAEAVRVLLLHLDAPGRFLDLVERMLEKREQWLPLLPEALDLGRLEGNWRTFLETRCAAAGDPPGGRGEAAVWLARFGPTRDDVEGRLERLRRLARSLLTKKGEWYRAGSAGRALAGLGVAGNAGPDRGDWVEAWKRLRAAFVDDEDTPPPDWLVEIADLPDPGLGDRNLLSALLLALARAVVHLGTIFRRERRVDFIEITRLALDALGSEDDPTDLGLALDYRLRHLLVDEFQDTSLTHYAFLTRLVSGWEPEKGRTFFAVGDPMQSIYRFRQADVAVFLDVRRRKAMGSLPLEPLVLHRNFRSAPALVDWVNRFARAFPARDDPGRGEVRFVPAVAARPDDSEAGVRLHAAALPEEEADDLAALLAGPEASSGRRAILLRSRNHAPAVVGALRARGVRVRLVDIVALAAVPAVEDLLALTEALLHPADRRAWFAVLRAPWCGLGNTVLLALAERADPPGLLLLGGEPPPAGLGEADAALLAGAARALARGVELVARHGLRRGVEATWLALGGPALLDTEADLRAAERYLALLDEPGIVELWRLDPARFEKRVRDLHAPEEAAGEDAPEILTVHQAKGLEWDVVFLPALARRTRSGGGDLLAWQEVLGERGERLLLLAPRLPPGSCTRDLPSAYKYLQTLEKKREGAEIARLAYVAATRARTRLHLFLPAVRPGQSENRNLAEVFAKLVDDWPTPRDPSPAPPAEPAAMSRLRTGLARPFVPPFRSADEKDRRTLDEDGQEDEGLGGSRAAGRVLHAFLARLAGRPLPPPGGEAPPELGREPVRRALRAEGLEGEGLEEAERIVRAALAGALSDRRGRWILAPHAEARTEWELEWLDPAGEIRRLRLDRTFRDRRGRRWIVDYKLGRHEGGVGPAFLAEAVARHRPQLETYARALRAFGEGAPILLGLYFPLLRAWRAWPAAEEPPSAERS